MSRRSAGDGICVAVRVTPKSGRDALEGFQQDANGKPMLKVRIAAAPEAGKANAALIDLLADQFGVAKNAVTILRGESARIKRVHVRGDRTSLSARLAKIGGGA